MARQLPAACVTANHSVWWTAQRCGQRISLDSTLVACSFRAPPAGARLFVHPMSKPMQYLHEMPFGAKVLAHGGVEFSLWAPAAQRVELLVDGRTVDVPADDQGWCRRIVGDAADGSRHAGRIAGDP